MEKIVFDRRVGTIVTRPIFTCYSRLTPKDSVENGVLSHYCVFEEFDTKDLYPELKSSEYSIGNLIAVGSFTNTTYVPLSLDHDMNFVDQLSKVFAQNVSTTQE